MNVRAGAAAVDEVEARSGLARAQVMAFFGGGFR